jgi:hypothetical protein
MLSVMPAQKVAMLLAFSAASMKPMMSAIDVKPVGEAESHIEDLGDGPAILGHSTHHYRTTGRSVMHFTGATRSCDQTTQTRADVWTTTDSIGPAGPGRARAGAATQGAPAASSVIPSLDSTAMRRATRMRGRALRTETLSTVIRDGVAPQSAIVTDDVTEIRYGPVDPALFAPPSGYKVTDQRETMAGIDQKKMFEAMAPMFERLYCGTPAAK